ncbi:MAG: hypothetical protein GC151_03790 [Betaproteobacteria bacterium]|nr:hypothetical protein [Betaproteobacteria bacterium]
MTRGFRAVRSRQTGVVLVISLIVLVALTLAGIALVRSTDTGNLISGNMAFRTAALNAVDTGVESAFSEITGASGFASSPTVAKTTTAGQYSPVLLADVAPADGMPDVDWAGLPGTDVSGNTVRWVVERMCSDNVATPSEIEERCSVVPNALTMSFKQGELTPSANAISVAYRVTIRVEGPKNTIVYAQSVITM